MSTGHDDTPQATMDPSCVGPLFQRDGFLDSWLTNDGESIWLWRDGLALVLALDMASRCPTCGQHLSGRDRWSLLREDVLARRLFDRSYQ